MNSNHSNPTQIQRLLDYLDLHGSITPKEAIDELGIMRLASRISELRKSGYEIEGKMVKVPNRYGDSCRVKCYSLKGDSNG